MAAQLGGLMLVVSLVTAAPAAGGAPGVPTSTIKPAADHSARYCVSRYAPNRPVTVRNERAGATTTLHTNNRGSGCTHVPGFECGRSGGDRVVAVGTGADGNPATSSATVTTADAPGCATLGRSLPSTTGDHGRLLSGAGAVLLGVAGAVVIALAAIGVVAIRRRRAAPEP